MLVASLFIKAVDDGNSGARVVKLSLLEKILYIDVRTGGGIPAEDDMRRCRDPLSGWLSHFFQLLVFWIFIVLERHDDEPSDSFAQGAGFPSGRAYPKLSTP